ncbi:MAG: hypothetical protein IRY99_08365 [Isosphaeraceae bacterium]|nr:hypothetical protein [Isosphaeraceae bacterium]
MPELSPESELTPRPDPDPQELIPERIETDDQADRILAKILRAESRARAYRAELKVVTANYLRMIKRLEAKAEYLRYRYGPQLFALAQRRLAGKRERTYVLPHGRIAVRKTRAALKITNDEAAVAWMQQHAPERLRVHYDVRAVEALEAWQQFGDLDLEAPPWMEVRPAGEQWKILTDLREEAPTPGAEEDRDDVAVDVGVADDD